MNLGPFAVRRERGALRRRSGRLPAEVADTLVATLELDGSGRLLDVGCGPGSLTLLLAPHFAEAIGIDADADMLTEAARLAEKEANGQRQLAAPARRGLPADLSPVRVVTFAQSFHWMDRGRVAAAVRGMLVPGGPRCTCTPRRTRAPTPTPRCRTRSHPARPSRGSCSATSDQSAARDGACCCPEHPTTRTRSTARPDSPGGCGSRCPAEPSSARPTRSSRRSTPCRARRPHLFGDRPRNFYADLRQLLAEISRDGRFSEQMRSITVDIWRWLLAGRRLSRPAM